MKSSSQIKQPGPMRWRGMVIAVGVLGLLLAIVGLVRQVSPAGGSSAMAESGGEGRDGMAGLPRDSEGGSGEPGREQGGGVPAHVSSIHRVEQWMHDRAPGVDMDGFAALTIESLADLSGDERIRMLGQVARWLAEAGAEEARSFHALMPAGEERLWFAAEMTRLWAASDPRLAVDWVNGMVDPVGGARLHTQLAREWARHDLEGALQWAAGLPMDGYQTEALAGIAFIWASEDVAAAFDWASAMADVPQQDRVLAMMVKMISRESPDAATQWAAGLPASRESAAALNYAIQAWARTDVAGATAWLATIEDAGQLVQATKSVAMGWSSRDPEAAANWLMGWDAGDERVNVMGSVMAKWATLQPEDALGWLAQLPASESASRDLWTRKLFEQVAGQNRDQALKLLEHVTSSEMRKVASQAVEMPAVTDTTSEK